MKIATVQWSAFQIEDSLYEWYARPTNLEVGPGSIWHWKLEMVMEMANFQQMCKREQYSVFLDVGAHCGIFSSVYCSLVRYHKCYSIEPVRDHVDRMKSIAETNGFDMHPSHLAFDDRDRVVRYDNPHMARWIDELGGTPDEETLGEVHLMTMDEFVKDKESPDIIKVDTEGYEIPILRGAQEVIHSVTPTLFMETHIAESEALGHNLEEIVDLLPEHLYDFKQHGGEPIPSLREFIFQDQNQRFIAVKK